MSSPAKKLTDFVVVLCSLWGAAGCASHGDVEIAVGTEQGAATCASDPESAVTLYVSTSGKSRADGGKGTCSEPFLTLQDAEDEIDARDPADDESSQRINSTTYTVYLRGGTYAYQERLDGDGHLILDQVHWRVASSQHRIRITAYPGERPVFDGRGIAASAIRIGIARGGCGTASNPLKPTRIEITRLTFRHYVERGIYLRGGSSENESEDEYNAGCQGGLTLAYNVFERIGDVYNNVCLEPGKNCLAAVPMSSADKARVKCWRFDDDGNRELCMGRAGIGGFNSRNNSIHHNVFSRNESADQVVFGQDNGSRITAHAFYVANYSNGNVLEKNFVEYSSGDAFKVRNRSSNNLVKDNLIVFTGGESMILNIAQGSDERPGTGNSVSGNVTLFGYPYRDLVTSRSEYVVKAHASSSTASQYQWTGTSRFHEGRRAEYERIGGMAVGDVDGDGESELFASLKYPAFDISVIRRSSSTGGGRFLDQLVEVVRGKDINHLAIGKLESGKPPQLVSNWHYEASGTNQTELWRGDGRPFGGGKNIDEIYSNDNWVVTALAIGNFDNSGVSELLSAFRSDGGTRRVYRGTGTSIGSSIYETTTWDILAMTPLRPNGVTTQDTLYTSFRRYTDSGFEARIYAGNGVSSVTNGGSVRTSTTRSYRSLAARPAALVAHGDPIAAELYATTKADDETQLWAYRPDGSAIGELEDASTGEFAHVVYGRVGDQPATTTISHEIVSNVLYSISETEIRSTDGHVFHEFDPATPCEPAKWSCE